MAYLAPGGVGLLVGAIATIATLLPQVMDKTNKLVEQQRKLERLEQDIRAYSGVVKKISSLLSKEEASTLFEDKSSKTLINIDKGSRDDDSWIAAELRISKEGAYYVWCTTGMNSDFSGASMGRWLIRGDAIGWVSANASANDLVRIFGKDALNEVGHGTSDELCS